MLEGFCKIDGCAGAIYALGYCRKHRERIAKHGDPHWDGRSKGMISKHPMYSAWSGMINRCTNPNHSSYTNYGGAGITVCDRWRYGEGKQSGLEIMIEDIGTRPMGMSLDRIDPNGPYSPDNCRWADASTQRANQTDKSKAGAAASSSAVHIMRWNQKTVDITPIGRQIHAAAALHGKSLNALSRDMGYKHSGFLSAVCRGRKKPPQKVLAYIEALLGSGASGGDRTPDQLDGNSPLWVICRMVSALTFHRSASISGV